MFSKLPGARGGDEHGFGRNSHSGHHVTAPKTRRGYMGKRGDLCFIGCAQPAWEPTEDPAYRGSVLTRAQKLAIARNYTFSNPLPLCIDHAEGAGAGFVVPDDKVIGFVTGILVDRNDNWLITGYIDGKRRELDGIIGDIQFKRRQWGLSAYTRFNYENEREDSIIPESKRITHVGVTLNPAFADDGSWIFECSTNPEAIARVVRDREIQQHGCLANEECMDAWGVAPNVKQHVTSVLAANIAQPHERPDPWALPPTPDYPRTTTTMASNAPNGGTQQQPVTDTNTKPVADAQTQQAPAGTQQQQQTNNNIDAMDVDAPAEVTDGVKRGILDGLLASEAQIAKLDPVKQHEQIDVVLQNVDGVLKSYKLSKDVMPEPFAYTYYKLRNTQRSLTEQWSNELQKFGGASNNFNKEFVEKMRSNGTAPEMKREIGGWVEATKAERATSQKAFEEELAKKRTENEALDRSYKEQMEAKRKAEDELATLRAEHERLKRRHTDTAPITRALGPNGVPQFNFSPALPAQQQQQQQQAPVPKQPVFDFTGAGQRMHEVKGHMATAPETPVHATNVPVHAQLGGGSGAHSLVLGGDNRLMYNSAEQQRASQEPGYQFGSGGNEGFVSATGFTTAEPPRLVMDSNPWLSTFVLDPMQSSFQSSKRADGSYDPVFVRTYQHLSQALSSSSGLDGTAFYLDAEDAKRNTFRTMNDAAVFGMSQDTFNTASRRYMQTNSV